MRDISPALPASIRVTFAPYPCGSATWASIPVEYHVDSKYSDSTLASNSQDGYSGILTIIDTAHAVYQVTTVGASPSNSLVLSALATQISLDYWSWRLYAFDRVYTGIAAPAPDGLVDSIRWEMTADSASTRIQSAPWDSHSEQLNHSDYADDCDANPQVFSPTLSITGGALKLPILELWVDDGLLKWVSKGSQTITICPGS